MIEEKNNVQIDDQNGNSTKPLLAVVPKCSHFWKMVTKNYYKCGWCDERHYC